LLPHIRWIDSIAFGIECGANWNETRRLVQNVVYHNHKLSSQKVSFMQFRSTYSSAQASLVLSKDAPQLNVSFTAGAISSFGGLPLLEKIARVSGLLDGAASRLKDHRTQSLIDYNKLTLLKQCVLLTAAGNPDTNDADRFRFDPALLVALGLDVDGSSGGLASQPSICRFLNSVTAEELDALGDWLLEFYLRQKPKPKRLFLYADGTAIETYGSQEGAVYRGGKYGIEMYFPLTIYDQDGWLLAAKLRRGDKSEAKTIVEVLDRLVSHIRKHWRNIEIVLVVDSGFRSSRLLNWCEQNRIYYLAGYGNSFAIDMKPEVKLAKKKAEKHFRLRHGEPRFPGEEGKQKAHKEHARIRGIANPKERTAAEAKWRSRRVRVFVDTWHKATTWPKEDPERRLIAKFDYTDRGLDGRRVLTNLRGYTAEQLYKMYTSRGTSEKWIGETKSCFHIRFNSQSFNANQFRLYIHALAYTLCGMLRSLFSQRFRRLAVDSVRKIFIEIPVLITHKSKWKLLWELTARFPYRSEFLRVCRKLNQPS
jgi:hypothetical protein